MHEAIDFNALSWLRQELGETLRKAQVSLDEYATNRGNTECLRKCAAQLHEARGPLRMVELKGADRLAAEMEELIADLLQGTLSQEDAALELLMQAFLQLPDYLSAIGSRQKELPVLLLPVINALRASRGASPLQDRTFFAPNLAAPMPASEFTPGEAPAKEDVHEMARAARVHFQSGLLEWYRGGAEKTGLQSLVDVLDHLRHQARSEPVARLWWVGAGVAEALLAGDLGESPETKQLFGRLDRQIKRLLDDGEGIFTDDVTTDLLESLLFQISRTGTRGGRIAAIKSTYGLGELSGDEASITAVNESLAGCSDELLQTVAAKVQGDIEHIKNGLEEFIHSIPRDAAVLAPLAEEMHALGNTLEMLGMQQLGQLIAEQEQVILGLPEEAGDVDETQLTEIANILVAVEDALAGAGNGPAGLHAVSDSDSVACKQGLESVYRQVIADMIQAKELFNGYLKSPEDHGPLDTVNRILGRVQGSLQMIGEERAAAAAGSVQEFFVDVMKTRQRILNDTQLDMLADVICSVEYYVEGLSENSVHGDAVLEVAERQLAGLGRVIQDTGETRDTGTGSEISSGQAPVEVTSELPEPLIVADAGLISGLQVVDAGADQEILEIFLEEADEELQALGELVPAWITGSGVPETSSEVRRILHTLKGSGRMVGALAIGEFAWILENLVNRIIDGSIPDDERFRELLGQSVGALSQLVAQIKDSSIIPEADIDKLAQQAEVLSQSVVNTEQATIEPAPAAEASAEPQAGDSAQEVAPDATPDVTQFPVLIADADQEIVEIFLEEAGEELTRISALLPGWISQPDDAATLGELRRSFHMLKGSGRMAGAMLFGEFSCSIETLLKRVLDGALQFNSSLATLLVRVPESLSQLIEQVRSGTAPDLDINEMMTRAAALGTGAGDALPVEADAEETALDVVAPVEPGGEMGEPGHAEIVLEPDAEEIALDVAAAVEPVGEMGEPDHAEIVLEPDAEEITLDVAAAVEPGGAVGEPDHAEIVLEPGAEEITLDVSAAGEPGGAVGEPDQVENTVDEPSLIDIFTNECRDHLQAIEEFLAAGTEPREVSDSLYRALHTLSGISDSADVTSIKGLANDLNRYFDDLYQGQLIAGGEALAVLHDSMLVIADLVSQLPELSFDEGPQQSLRERIAGLPKPEVRVDSATADAAAATGPAEVAPEEAAEQDAGMVAGDSDATVAGVVQETDPYDVMDPELYEIFVEEASEIIEGSETVLRAWSDEPDNRELMAEFQRQLHTLKGGARMVDIPAIGDLGHAMESLLTRIADGAIVVTAELFILLRDSQDRLAEMLDRVKVREWPEAAPDMEAILNGLASGEVADVAVIEPGAVQEAAAIPEDAADIEQATQAEETAETAAEELAETAEAAEATEATEAAEAAEATEAAEVTEAAEAAEAAEATEVTEAAEIAEVAQAEETAAEPVAVGPDYVAARETRPDDVTAAAVTAQLQDAVAAQNLGSEMPAEAIMRSESAPPPVERRKRRRSRRDQVKVHSELLDDMVNYAGEINIYRARMEQQISDFRFNLAELDQTISRLRDQLRQLEMETEAHILSRHEQYSDDQNQDFDPLEMDRYSNLQQTSRSLMESITDLRSLQELMENTTRDSETLLLQQSRVSTDLQEGLMRTRMTPFASLTHRLRRIVRQSASQLGKKAEVELQGAEGEMDRTVIERIVAPLEHMLRNAVAHGIESPQVREKAGKPETGNITITFEREGPEIILQISDDGAGMNVEAIRSRAVERGLLSADSEMSDDDIIQFVLQTGFSTAGEVTQISGRGVGMDVVNSEVKQLGGSLHIKSDEGKGSVITVRLPYTVAITQALLVKAGEETFCIPIGSVEGVVRAIPEELLACYRSDDCVYEYAGNRYRLKHLGSMLNTGGMDQDQPQPRIPVLLIRIGERRLALQVESLLGSREIVIKPLGVQLSVVDGISGATILGDGRVVMILDMVAVSRMHTQARLPEMPMGPRDEARLVVMVVDDSITVRKVTARLLERNGYKVLTAKDGVDAMGQLQNIVPDMMLLDIEMPRMDGFELATHMRNDDRFRHVPIIMITSRTGEKHRERAQEIGVNNYLGKPYQENELLDTIHHIIGVSNSAAAVV